MAAENFKVKKGLEVGTAITATSSGVNVTGIVTATQFVGDGSGLTGVTGSGSGVVVKDEGSAVGTAGTINFVGSGVAATLSQGTATVTINSGGLSDVVADTTPQLGGNLDLNGKFVNGTGGANITGVVTATGADINGNIDVDGHTNLDNVSIAGVTTFSENVQIIRSSGLGNLTIQGGEGTNASINLKADDGDDNGDHWQIKSVASDNDFVIANDTSGALVEKLAIATDGTVSITNKLQISGNSTEINFVDLNNNPDFRILVNGGKFRVQNTSNGNANVIEVLDTGNVNFDNGITVGLDLDVDGQTDLDDLVVSGVGTFSTRIDTNGVELGTNTTTFAAKFADDAVANFGGGNDLKIYHESSSNKSFIVESGSSGLHIQGSNIVVDNTAGDKRYINMVDGGGVSLYYNTAGGGTAKLETTNAGVTVNGTLTATTFSGSGASLTNLPSAQLTGALPALDGSALTGVTASGTGIIVRHDGSVVGTASSINFSTNLDVSAISAGIVTVTASGSSGVSLSGSTNNTVATVTGSNALIGEANLTFDGSTLAVGGSTNEKLIFSGSSNPYITFKEGTTTKAYVQWNSSGYLDLVNQESSEVLRIESGSDGLKYVVSGTEYKVWHELNDGASSGLDADLLDGQEGSYYTNATNLGSGTIPNGRFPATLPATSGANLTALNASEITSGTLPIARIADDAVTFAKMQNVGTGVIIGRNDAGSGDIETLSAADVRTLINVENGATADQTAAEIRTLVESASDSNVFTDADHSKLDGIAAGATVGITTSPDNVVGTWSVTANGSSAYRFTGPGQSGNEDDPDIYLVRGQRYSFINTTGSSHPFRFRVSSGGSTYSDGVSGSENGTQYFNVQHDAPASLVYQCTIHSGMVGNIYIVGQHLANGANNRVLTATSAYGMTGESTLTYNGSDTFELQPASATPAIFIGDSNRTGAGQGLAQFRGNWNGTTVARITFDTGDDTTNKDDGFIRFDTSSTGSLAERVRITRDGKLGIGNVSSPDDKVEIRTFSNDMGVLIKSTGSTSNAIKFDANRSGANQGLGSIKAKWNGTTVAQIFMNTGDDTTDKNDGYIIFGTESAASNGNVNATGRLRIDSDGAVNIGSNPAQATGTNTQNAILTVKGYPAGETSAAILALVRGNNTTSTAANHTMGRIVFSDKQAGEYAFIEGEAEANGAVGDTPGRLVFSTSSNNSSAPTERLRIDSSGRLGLNQSTPASRLHISEAGSNTITIQLTNATTGHTAGNDGMTMGYSTNSSAGFINVCESGSDFTIKTGGTGSANERLRITSGGKFGFGTSSPDSSYRTTIEEGTSGHGVLVLDRTSNIDGNFRSFVSLERSGTAVGTILCNNSSTQYNTTSDHRLKENVVTMSNATDRLKQLQPKRFNFILNPDITVDGFLAHEVQSVVPEAISGTKDEVDSDNNPVYQGIDQSKLVPLLTAALQEAITEIETLKAKVAALEGS